MKRLIFTLIALFMVSLAGAQAIEYPNENGLIFTNVYGCGQPSLTFKVVGPITVYNIQGHMLKHLDDVEIDLMDPTNDLTSGTYIIVPQGYKPFLMVNGRFSHLKTGHSNIWQPYYQHRRIGI